MGADGIRWDLIEVGNPTRIYALADAMRKGASVAKIHEVSAIDPWFLAQLEDLVAEETALKGQKLDSLDADPARLAELEDRLAAVHSLARKHRVPVVVEVILERITNIAMGTEIDKINEFEDIDCRHPEGRQGLEMAGLLE